MRRGALPRMSRPTHPRLEPLHPAAPPQVLAMTIPQRARLHPRSRDSGLQLLGSGSPAAAPQNPHVLLPCTSSSPLRRSDPFPCTLGVYVLSLINVHLGFSPVLSVSSHLWGQNGGEGKIERGGALSRPQPSPPLLSLLPQRPSGLPPLRAPRASPPLLDAPSPVALYRLSHPRPRSRHPAPAPLPPQRSPTHRDLPALSRSPSTLPPTPAAGGWRPLPGLSPLPPIALRDSPSCSHRGL